MHGAGEWIDRSIANVNVQVVPAGLDDCANNEQVEDELHCPDSVLYLERREVNHAEEIYNSADFNEQHYPVRIVD